MLATWVFVVCPLTTSSYDISALDRPRATSRSTSSSRVVSSSSSAGAGSDAPRAEHQLLSAIRVAADGGSLFSPSVTRRLIEQFSARGAAEPAPAELDELTTRELEVLRLVARGLSNAEISSELVVSEHTTKTHVASILQKLGLRNRVQAVVLAYESGVVRAGGA